VFNSPIIPVTRIHPYLKCTDNRPDDHCWWCDPENISGTQQTRDPAVLDFLRGTYVGRAAPPVEETWDSEDEGTERWGRVRRRRGGGSSDQRARLSLLFSFYVVTVLFMSGGRGDEGAATEPALQRQETEKIVYCHSLLVVSLNASMRIQKKIKNPELVKSHTGTQPHRHRHLNHPQHQRFVGIVLRVDK